MTSELCDQIIDALLEAYPLFRSEILTTTAFGRPVRTLVIGNGDRKVLYSASHHANEWITSLVLLKFAEDYAAAIESDGQIGGRSARALSRDATIYIVPMVDPDGVDLVTGAIAPGSVEYELARILGDNYPDIPFPDGWKANIRGVDLNLQFPAGWQNARQIKFAQGFNRPAPRDFVGFGPLTEPESLAIYNFTLSHDFSLVIAYHTQGQEIYWNFQNINPHKL